MVSVNILRKQKKTLLKYTYRLIRINVLCGKECVYYILVFIFMFIMYLHKLFNDALSK